MRQEQGYSKMMAGAAEQNMKDILQAMQLQPKEWRYGAALITWYNQHQQKDKSLLTAQKYYQQNKENYQIGMLYAEALIANGKYREARKVMTDIYILPNEGSTDGRDLFKEAVLMLAVNEIKNKNYQKALIYIAESRKWPDNLGVGKPYDSDIDERLEDWMDYLCFTKIGNAQMAKERLRKILQFNYAKNAYGRHISEANNLITAWALKASGDNGKAQELMNSDLIKNAREDENMRVMRRLD
jgi:hypothetical protein